MIKGFCFATGIRGSARHSLGNKSYSPEGEGGSELVLTNANDSSLVVDTLCDQTRGQNTSVTCFYFDFAARNEQSATNMLGSLLKQMVSGTGRIPEEILKAMREQQEAVSGRRPQLVDIVKMLQLVMSSQRTYMCIDALDECTTAQRFRLFDSLKEILEKSPSARVFVTGRPHIRAEVAKHLAGRVASVSVGPTKGDIISYLRFRLSHDETPDAMDESLEADILEKMPESISETYVEGVNGTQTPIPNYWLIGILRFLLVSLNIESILQESTIHRRRGRLCKITDGLGLGDAYDATIERIRAQDGDKSSLGMRALMWISHAERPLKVDELCYALAVELGSTDFNPQNLPSISTLVSCCQGLITVDKEASTVRLIHFTLKEYLCARPDIFGRHHSTMAEICLTYLNSGKVKALSADPSLLNLETPFLKYCSRYWGVHAKGSFSSRVRSLTLELLQDYDRHISARSLLAQVRVLYYRRLGMSLQFSGLHCASFFGIAEGVVALIAMESYDINNEDYWGHTPLAWAARNGHEGVAEILLQQAGVDPDKADNYGNTPLMLAARGGNEGVVKVLLERGDVNPEKLDDGGLTPLQSAAQGGYEGVVKVLLERGDVDPERLDDDGLTPLQNAAWRGHEGIVKVLLERGDVDPERLDNYGLTPLQRAARRGYEGVARALLERGDVSPEKPDDDGITSLQSAAQRGHEGVVKVLLERGEMNPDKQDNRGDTALLKATRRGHEKVVKILLAQAAVSPDKPNHHGSTPLLLAAQYGYENVVKMLLGREEVNPDKRDNHGDTSLSCAARYGHEGIVKILLEKERVNPDNTNHAGRTPVICAVKNGHKGVVELLKLHQAAAHGTPLGPEDATW